MHLAIIGYGNIAQTAVSWLHNRPVTRLTVLVRKAALDGTKQDDALAGAARSVVVTDDIDALIAATPDLVVECAGHQAVRQFAPAVLSAGLDMVLVSIGALADDALFDALEMAAKSGRGQMILPAGAIGGIDLLAALALAGDTQVTYRGTKPPAAWRGTPAEKACDLEALTEACEFFSGTARDAAMMYPKNANVAATLALAGPGFDATQVRLIADPAAKGNAHAFEVESAAGRFSVQVDNSVSSGNAQTSVATVYSVIREINRKRETCVI